MDTLQNAEADAEVALAPLFDAEIEPDQDDIPLAVIEISDELMHAIHRC
ncbi:hypothetical protein [Paludibacterium yongneupense]|nr:hypothetical protein [Paludibacterium yongneupense]